MKVVRLGRDISPYFVGFHQRASAYLCGPKESLLWRKHQGPPLQGESSVDFAFNLHLLYQRIITEQLAINYLVHLVPSKLVSKDLSAETWLKDDASIPQTSFCRRIQLSTTWRRTSSCETRLRHCCMTGGYQRFVCSCDLNFNLASSAIFAHPGDNWNGMEDFFFYKSFNMICPRDGPLVCDHIT